MAGSIGVIGGAGNISSAGNCMTRLRLVLKDESKANDAKVEAIRNMKNASAKAKIRM